MDRRQELWKDPQKNNFFCRCPGRRAGFSHRTQNWGKHDYKHKSNHFGPLAVDTGYQGMEVGKGLLTHYWEYPDTTDQTGYLETDQAENVALYQKFCFRIIETDRVCGIENWFMARK